MKVQKEIIITVVAIDDKPDENNLIYGQYTDDEQNAYIVVLGILKRFKINVNQNLHCTFNGFLKPYHPLKIIIGSINNKEVHENSFSCDLLQRFQIPKVIPNVTIEQLEALTNGSTDTEHHF